VEAVLLSQQDVAEACVAGIPDEHWGMVVAAALVLKKKDADIRNIEAQSRRVLAGYKIPKRWLLLSELPKTESGKIRRKEVAALLAAAE
jgi:acyl-coenzyme A synthetase/AMP-(fatty) acid ligase